MYKIQIQNPAMAYRVRSNFDINFQCLTGSPFMNQERFAGGLLCQDVHVAVTRSPTLLFALTPVIRGFLSGRSVIKRKQLGR